MCARFSRCSTRKVVLGVIAQRRIRCEPQMKTMSWQHRLHTSPQTTHVLPHSAALLHCQRQAFRSCRRHTSCASLPDTLPSRRSVLATSGAAAMLGMLSLNPQVAAAADDPPKLTGLTVQQMMERVKEDFQEKQYYVTGNFSPELFTDDCLFVDPTVQVRGWRFYQNAVKLLFDANTSRTDIRSTKLIDDRAFSFKWRQEGRIKPWFNAEIKPYCGETTFRLNSDGLIYEHLETWDAPAYDVFLSVFSKQFGVPACPPVEGVQT